MRSLAVRSALALALVLTPPLALEGVDAGL